MNQLAVREEVNFDVILKDVESMQKMCRELMKTKHYQKMGEDGIFAIIQSSKSLGLNPLEGLNGALYYVQGKVGMGAETMNALIRRRGHSIVKDPKSDNTICILHGKRSDTGDTWTVRFSVDDAKRAGLFKNMYDKYPGVMLYNRAMSMLARQLFPDIIHNAGYNKDELEEIGANKSSFEPFKLPSEPFEEVVTYIDGDQGYQIRACVDSLDNETRENFFSYLKKKCNTEVLDMIPSKDFDHIYNLLKVRLDAAKKAKEKEQAKIEEAKKEEVKSELKIDEVDWSEMEHK